VGTICTLFFFCIDFIKNGNKKRKLSEKQIKELRSELYKGTAKELAKKYGCSVHVISDIRRNKIYSFEL